MLVCVLRTTNECYLLSCPITFYAKSQKVRQVQGTWDHRQHCDKKKKLRQTMRRARRAITDAPNPGNRWQPLQPSRSCRHMNGTVILRTPSYPPHINTCMGKTGMFGRAASGRRVIFFSYLSTSKSFELLTGLDWPTTSVGDSYKYIVNTMPTNNLACLQTQPWSSISGPV